MKKMGYTGKWFETAEFFDGADVWHKDGNSHSAPASADDGALPPSPAQTNTAPFRTGSALPPHPPVLLYQPQTAAGRARCAGNSRERRKPQADSRFRLSERLFFMWCPIAPDG